MPIELDALLSLPGNRVALRHAAERVRGRSSIAIVGSGASAAMYPTWPQFIADALQRYRADAIQLDDEIGEHIYRIQLRKTFGESRHSGGPLYTNVHGALLNLPFCGYLTTNYDSGLDHARMKIRLGCTNSATPTWEDLDEVHRWRTGDALQNPGHCPILWLHGHWQRPDSCVHNAGRYHDTYRPAIYRETLVALWSKYPLMFVGYDLDDPQLTFMIHEILSEVPPTHTYAHHLAFLGLASSALGDLESIERTRDRLRHEFRLEPIFYPLTHPDALQSLLDALIETPTLAVDTGVCAPSQAAGACVQHWEHETTNDLNFTGRVGEIARLDRWVEDISTRIVGVCAMGGTGKTALVGHWLKNTTGWSLRGPFTAVFGWSFYQDLSVPRMLNTFLVWASKRFGTILPSAKPVRAALHVLNVLPCILVLDGLEVLQEGSDEERYGRFLDPTLRDLLNGACRFEQKGIIVLTSRFVFTDLDAHAGTSFHALELSGLNPEEGADLLASLGVRGSAGDRMALSARLEGHPMGLRIFANVLPEEHGSSPLHYLDDMFHSVVSDDSTLQEKLKRLLAYYERRLPPLQCLLLSIIAIFRTPVSKPRIFMLCAKLLEASKLEATSEGELEEALNGLYSRHVLTREPLANGTMGSACHPILRDHFRGILVDRGQGRQVADFIQGLPLFRAQAEDDISIWLLVIELLLDCGDYVVANKLFSDRLGDGRVFQWRPAFADGLKCVQGFVRNKERQLRCAEQLSPQRMAKFLGWSGLFFAGCGDYAHADATLRECTKLTRTFGNTEKIAVALQNQTESLLARGELRKARACAEEAVKYANAAQGTGQSWYSYAYMGRVSAVTGEVEVAAARFALATAFQQEQSYGKFSRLYSLLGIWHAELLIRTRSSEIVELGVVHTQWNFELCKRQGWKNDALRCQMLLGWAALQASRLEDAAGYLEGLDVHFRRAEMQLDLTQAYLLCAAFELARNDVSAADEYAAEALSIAGPRRMKLAHIDALILRSRVRVRRAGYMSNRAGSTGTLQAEKLLFRAKDDGEEALRLARASGYVWGERDALALLVDIPGACESLEVRERRRAELVILERRLQLTGSVIKATSEAASKKVNKRLRS